MRLEKKERMLAPSLTVYRNVMWLSAAAVKILNADLVEIDVMSSTKLTITKGETFVVNKKGLISGAIGAARAAGLELGRYTLLSYDDNTLVFIQETGE